MVCFLPIQGYKSRELTENGSRKLVFNPTKGYSDLKMQVPCCKCDGCLAKRKRDYTARCVHESQFHEESCFLTLTYDDEFLPEGRNLKHYDFNLFMKRFRLDLWRRYKKKVKYFMCGEYGDKYGRPHYHVILFGMDFRDDRVFSHFSKKDGISRIFTSEYLNNHWAKGNCFIGSVTSKTCSYVAKYLNKTSASLKWSEGRVKPYNRSSHHFGKKWIEKYLSEVYPSDEVILDGKPQLPPRYYDQFLKRVDLNLYYKVKANRLQRMKDKAEDNTPERLFVKAQVFRAGLNVYCDRDVDSFH